jgi:amino acid adenylation domain-containing protein
MPEEAANIFRLSPQQEEQWRREPAGPSGRTQAVVRLDGRLDSTALSTALRRVVERHESLRTTFAYQAGVRIPFQVANDALEPGWEELGTALDAETPLDELLASERERPVDFKRGPLLRALLIDIAPDGHVLVLTVSTLCADPASMSILVRELAHHYGAATEIVEDVLQYADFSAWQLELSESEDDEARAARVTWNALEGASAPQVPFARHSTATFVPDEITTKLEASAAPGLVHAAWHALIRRVTGEERVAVSVLSPDRRHADLAGAIGAFARPVPISTQLDGASPFAELIEELQRARARVLELQDYAPAKTSAELTVGFCDYDAYQWRTADLAITLERIVTTGAPWRLWLSCTRARAERVARLHFDPACYERESVNRLARQLEQLIGAALAAQSTPLDALPLLGESERHRTLREFNDTAAPVPAQRFHELFGGHALAAPERDAVLDEHGSISYRDLDARANQLAHRLRACGVRADVPVGLCTDRSRDMVIGLLGILKAGGGYIPMNYEHPPARLRDQLAAAGAGVIVTQEALLSRIAGWDGKVVCLDREADRAALDGEPVTAPEAALADDSLAYVIYTSGSTGSPKGVAVAQGNLANYVADITRRLGANSQSLSFGLVTSISTDLGNTSVFGALASGGTLVLVSPAAAADGKALASRLKTAPIDVLKITPSHLAALLAGGDQSVLPQRTLVLGGERAPWDLIERVRTLSSCAILNHYGPTEATVGCCTFTVHDGPGRYQPATVPIGAPIANASCYVLDDGMQLAPIGVPGTLFVGGAGVARGYIGEPELTGELFLADPFSDSPGARMYNTGDTVRWLPDGTLEFLGRSDEQVKIRGYRVEPAEVESALRSHVQVADAVVLAPQSSSGERRLVAYCTSNGAVADDELRSHLAALLPEFMIPSAVVMLEDMPRTPSGKIDRRSLPDPVTISDSGRARYLAPRTPIEELIATLWSQTLGTEQVGVEDDFFELGGHSLLATQVVAQIRTELAIDLPLHSLFTCPTVGLLAAEIVQLMGASEEEETAKLLAELEGLSDEEAQRLLAGETAQPDGGAR